MFHILNLKSSESHFINYNFEKFLKAAYSQKLISYNFLKSLILENLSRRNILNFSFAKFFKLKKDLRPLGNFSDS